MAVCRGCAREIIWMKTANNRAHPFDAKQTLLLIEDGNGSKVVRQGHVSHFATCPNAAQFSRKPAPEQAPGEGGQ